MNLLQEAVGDVDKGIGYLEFINMMTGIFIGKYHFDKQFTCTIGECRYVPGEGETEEANHYYGSTTENTAHPWTEAEQTQRAKTAIGRPSTNSQTSRFIFILFILHIVADVSLLHGAFLHVGGSALDMSVEVVSCLEEIYYSFSKRICCLFSLGGNKRANTQVFVI